LAGPAEGTKRPKLHAYSLLRVTDAIYQERDGTAWATDLTRGPWDPNAQHGGASGAIVMRALEQLDAGGADLQFARVTYELVRPAPLGELRLQARVVRPLDAGASPQPPHPLFDAMPAADAYPFGERVFPGGAVEVRMRRGGTIFDIGPAFGWFRLRVPIVAGETPSQLQRLVAAADFANGLSTELPWDQYLFINPDLTIYIEREPRGEWIGLDAQMRVVEGGVGLAQAVLYDEEGRVGRSLQSLYVARR
jgi:hypothetical protein